MSDRDDDNPTIGLERTIWTTIKNGGSWPLVIDTDGRGNFYVMGLDAYLRSRERHPANPPIPHQENT
jgi:hypothetical protein